MTAAESPPPKRHLLAWIVVAVAGVAGFRFSYGFGDQLGGALLGWVTGLNGALLCWVLADAALAWVERRRAASRPPTRRT